MTTKPRRVQRRDRPWLDSQTAVLAGPLPMPPLATVRDAVARVAAAAPHSRLTWGLDPSARRWTATRPIESIVVEREWEPGDDLGVLVDRMRDDRTLPHPVAVVRYPEYLGVVNSHAIGDGRNIAAILDAVLHTSLVDDRVDWPSRRSGPFLLLRTGVRVFGRHPLMIPAAVADRPRAVRPAAVAVTEPWAPARRTQATFVSRAVVDEARRRFRESGVRTNRFSILTCAVLRALREGGFPVGPVVNMMVDLRSYLDDRWVDGNFVASVPMAITADTGPDEFAAMIKATLRSGRPLAGQLRSSIRVDGRRRRRCAPPSTAAVGAPITVTVTDLGEAPSSHLPFIEDGRPIQYVPSAVPDGPDGLTVAFGHTPTSTVITTSFHANRIDGPRLGDAMRSLVDDLEGLSAARRSYR